MEIFRKLSKVGCLRYHLQIAAVLDMMMLVSYQW